ncbi:hypothetical protein M1116_00175 [Patescibacteria group bacterium]|nr:hypothetical protein [Patescibacteria group bacterium]
MKTVLVLFQIILGIAVAGLILLQASGDTESRSNILSTTGIQKRGWELIMYYITIGLIVVFLLSSVIQTII